MLPGRLSKQYFCGSGFLGQQRLADTWQFIDAITHAEDSGEVGTILMDLAGRYGCRTAFGGIVPPLGVRPDEIPDFVLIQQFPDAWAARYNEKGYLLRDPILHRLRATSDEAFTWADAYKSHPSGCGRHSVEEESKDFGLRQGIVVPIELLDRCPVAISFGGERLDYSPDDLHALAFATSYAIGRILFHKSGEQAPPKRLSPRERDCLAWVAEGKSDWEIAVILGISPATVEKHLLAVRNKLGAVTRSHAIAKAFRSGLLR